MARPFLNYTTAISVSATIGEIQGLLADAGADAVSITYQQRVPVAITFTIVTAQGELAYRLPVDLAGVLRQLERVSNEYGAADQSGRRKRKLPTTRVTPEHAARVGWRIVKDWIEAQVALIEVGLASLDQVMLPYQLVTPDKTVYQLAKERGLLSLPSGT